MCDELVSNASLRDFLTLVLQIGNCLNAVSTRNGDWALARCSKSALCLPPPPARFLVNKIKIEKRGQCSDYLYTASEHVFQGSYAGDAAGFKLNTLPKLLDTRANKPRMTFLHFVVQVAEANNKNALAFTRDLSNIIKICKYVC
jgi:hypothetical protein